MIFVDKDKINEFEKKCVIALFLDYYDDYELDSYLREYQFTVKIQGKVENIYLFNSPKDVKEKCKVFQLKNNSKSTQYINYIRVSPDFEKEFYKFTDNTFEYVNEKFWTKKWGTKYSILFEKDVPNIVMNTMYFDKENYFYKYKMNPDECESLFYKDKELGEIEDKSGVFCKTIATKKKWFQEFIDGKILFMNPNMFNDPFDCDCEIPVGLSYVKQLYIVLGKKVPIEIIEKALNVLGEIISKEQDIDTLIDILISEINRLLDNTYNDKKKKYKIVDVKKVKDSLRKFQADMINIKEMVRVLCLSPHHSDILMWGYYGNSGRGLCCEYEYNQLMNDILKQIGDAICIYGKVDYKNEKPAYNVNTHSKFNGLWDYVIKCMFTKYKKWEHEDEFRIVLLKDNFSSDVITVDGTVESYYLGCRNLDNPLENKYIFPSDKVVHQLKKDKMSYRLIE